MRAGNPNGIVRNDRDWRKADIAIQVPGPFVGNLSGALNVRLTRASTLRNADHELCPRIASVDLDGSAQLLSKGADQPHSQTRAFVRL